MEKLAAIDIGSNAIRFCIAHLDKEGILSIEQKQRIPLRLGTESFQQGHFSDETIEFAGEVFRGFRETLNKEGVYEVAAVATSAFRCADNSHLLAEYILDQSGIKIEEISGKKEANMILDAVKASVNIGEKDFLLIDIGGGSMELSFLSKGEVQGSQSYPYGTVRLLGAMQESKKPEKKLHKILLEAEQEIQPFLKQFCVNRDKPIRVIGTGGNFRRMVKLKKKLWGEDLSFLYPSELPLLYAQLDSVSVKERIKKFNLRADRADVILPALQLVMMVISDLPVKKIYAPDIGLMHGVLLSQLQGNFKKFAVNY